MKCFNCFYTKRSDRQSHKMTNSSSKASEVPDVHTITSQPNPRHEQPSRQDCKETVKTTQSKQGQAEGIPKEDAVVLKEWNFKTSESLITDGKTGKMTARTQSVNAKEPIKSSVSEKGDMTDSNEQRSLAKRRESKENGIYRLKRTQEKDSRKPSITSSKKLTLNGPRRKLKKDLIPNPEVFHKIDTHAINAGREVREIRCLTRLSLFLEEGVAWHMFIWICNLQLRIRKIFSVQAITQTITEGASSELDKLRAIWIWLCHYIGQFLSFSHTHIFKHIKDLTHQQSRVCFFSENHWFNWLFLLNKKSLVNVEPWYCNTIAGFNSLY